MVRRGMNLLDRAIAYLSPARANARLAQRERLDEMVRHYEGGSHGRRTAGWIAPANSASAAMSFGLDTLRARARDARRNDPVIKRAHQVVRTNVIGTGIVPRFFNVKEPTKAARARELWQAWAETRACDAEGRHNFYGLQRLAMDTISEAGSCLLRVRPRLGRDDLPLPAQLQLLEPDHLDKTKDRFRIGRAGDLVTNGVAFDADNNRLGYWLYKQHPGDQFATNAFESFFAPADRVAHVFWEDRKGQVDGVPWSSACLIKARDFADYDDAQLLRQKLAAAFVAFLKDQSPDETFTLPGQGANVADSSAFGVDELSPGAFEKLPPGKDVVFSTPPSVTGYREFSTGQLRQIAMGFGIAYESLSGDFSQVNFASGRMSLLREADNVDEWRWQMIVPHLCEPVIDWFLEAAAIAGEDLEGTSVRWTAPRRRMINPTEETNSAKASIRAGFQSISETIREQGGDPRETLEELAGDLEMLDELGLVLDSDPRPHAYSPGQQSQPPGGAKGSPAKAPPKPERSKRSKRSVAHARR